MGYNGWKNYETWAVALWLDNDPGTYHGAREVAWQPGPVPTEDVDTAAANLKAWVEEIWYNPAVDTLTADAGSGAVADLLGSAWQEVDWYEIAENYREEIPAEEVS